MDKTLDEIKDVGVLVKALIKKYDDYIVQLKLDVAKAMDDAIEADDNNEAMPLAAVKADVMAAMDKLPPMFDLSANG